MSDYVYADDGKIHTRFSELKRATYGQVEKLVQERHGKTNRFESPIMAFGTLRHETLQDESESTGRLPECFGIDEPATHIEQEFAVEIVPGVIVHFRPDVLSDQAVNDYKTVTASVETLNGIARKKYGRDMQLLVYAYLLNVLGLQKPLRRYLCEAWNVERTEVIGRDIYEAKNTIAELASARRWLLERVELLVFAEKQYQSQLNKEPAR